ncbi:MAG: hypothetical protein SH847_18865 [Roseiflexaceae bacterium]|nr:hypothetical protein [Roseiflexaceae bacterium]
MDQALTYYQLARTAGEFISDAEDKAIFDADFGAGNWYGLACL